MNAEAIHKWQATIESTFRPENEADERRRYAFSVMEKHHRDVIITKCYGFTALTDACQEFALQTMEEAREHKVVPNVWHWGYITGALRRFRCALNLFYDGYYFDAAANLRAVFETTLYVGASLNGWVAADELYSFAKAGVSGLTPQILKKQANRHRIKIEKNVSDRMRGANSGLSASEQEEIENLFWTMHSHTHRAESNVLNYVLEMTTMKTCPMAYPVVNEKQTQIFCNVAVCAGWALSRVLPFLSHPSLYSDGWRHRDQVLDESFAFYLTSERRSTFLAFQRFVNLNLSFPTIRPPAGVVSV